MPNKRQILEILSRSLLLDKIDFKTFIAWCKEVQWTISGHWDQRIQQCSRPFYHYWRKYRVSFWGVTKRPRKKVVCILEDGHRGGGDAGKIGESFDRLRAEAGMSDNKPDKFYFTVGCHVRFLRGERGWKASDLPGWCNTKGILGKESTREEKREKMVAAKILNKVECRFTCKQLPMPGGKSRPKLPQHWRLPLR